MSEFITQIHFIRPAALLLIPVMIPVWWLWQRRGDPLRGWRGQIEAGLLSALVVGRESSASGTARILPTAWLISAIAIAGPTWRLEPSPFAEDATPLMILLKTDVTMDLPDPAPTRLERAQLKITDLADARLGQPLGLIAYSGSAHMVLPPTRDTGIVSQMAGELSPAIMPEPGDRLDLALMEAGKVLKKGGQGGSILVIADSVDTEFARLSAAKQELPFPVQFLAVTVPDSSESKALQSAARVLGAAVVSLSANDTDIETIIRRAARTPLATAGDAGDRWQESGYWLIPLICLMFLANFRREAKTGEVEA